MLDTIFKRFKFYRNYRLYQVDNRRKQVSHYRSVILDTKLQVAARSEKLFSALKSIGVNTSAIPADWWKELFNSVRNKSETLTFSEQTNKLPVDLLNPAEWLELSSLLIGLTFYESALVLRIKAQENAFQVSNTGISKYLYADMVLGAALEKFDRQKITEALRNSRVMRGRCAKNANTRILNMLLTKGEWLYLDEKEERFKSLVESKKVAIVGPLTDEQKTSEEINAYDLIVKLNVLELDLLEESEICTDIIYNSNPIMSRFADKYEGLLVEKPLAIVCRASRYYKNLSGKPLFRAMPCLNAFTFNGGLNMLQRVIIDLIRFKPGQIKVFGSDLYASLDYNENYQAGVNEGKFRYYADQLVQHDLITQYIVTKRLHDMGFFRGDERFEEILSLGLKGYLKRMQRIYRKYVLPED